MPSLLFRLCKLNFQRMQTASPHGRLNLVSLPPPYLRTLHDSPSPQLSLLLCTYDLLESNLAY